MLKGMPEGLWLPLILLIPVALIEGIISSTLRAVQNFVFVNLLRLLSAGTMLAGVVFLMVTGQSDLTHVILVYILSIALLLAPGLLMAWRYTSLPGRPKAEMMKNMLLYGVKSHARSIIESMNARLDIYLMAIFLSPDQIAFYSVAFSFAEMAWYLPDAVGSVLFPRLANTAVEEVHAISARICRSTLALTGLELLLIALVSIPLLPLFYGPAYGASILPLMVLLPGILCMSGYKVLARDFASRDRQQITVVAALVAFGLIVSLDLWLIPAWGVFGAAFASSVGYSSAGLVLLWFFLRESGLPAHAVLLVKRTDFEGFWQAIRQMYRSRVKAASS